MKIRPLFLPIFTLLALLLAGCSGAQQNEVTIKLEAMRFNQSDIEVQAGEPVTLHLINKDGYAHAFDMDDFDIHVPLAASETTEVTFTPTQPGTYAFYCGSPGHQAAGMAGSLVVTP